VRTFLGVDGGGSKTAFLLIDETGRVLSSHSEGPAYYLEIGLEELRAMLARGIHATLSHTALTSSALTYSFIGVPAYGEDSQLLSQLDSAASPTLAPDRYRCGNDAICGWAGALACQDGINIVAGTGSIAYGEYSGRSARAGGWGELFSDEGSAYWVAREGLKLFTRMSDGRTPRSALYDVFRDHFRLQSDLDLCAAVYGKSRLERSHFAALAPLVAQAAAAGDALAADLFGQAADELVQIVRAIRRQLVAPANVTVPVSYSGGMFELRDLLLNPLQAKLASSGEEYRLMPPRFSPAAGAALYAAQLSGASLDTRSLDVLHSQLK
jgi:N-acetylglucosamine kinase-like BadF-type ATPase